MSKMLTIEQRGIYTDLMRKFRSEGHDLYIVSPTERRDGRKTMLIEQDGVHILSVKTLNVQKTNVIEKGLGQVSIEFLFKNAIHKHFADVEFDLILYSTPPITLMGVVKDMKKCNPKAKSYLLLKDIFPQNAVDMGMMSKTGVKALLYKYFRKQEEDLYKVSDFIGCMSPANVQYVLKHNAWIDPKTVEVAPNNVTLVEESGKAMEEDERKAILEKYGLPTDKPIFIYGGNLGVPQGIPFLIECLEANKNRTDCHFVVVGTGTYYPFLEKWYNENVNENENEKDSQLSTLNSNLSVTVMKGLPKEDYDKLVRACNVGLIFLDYRFEIPNFPSRLLSYLENKMPVICATDPNCDMGAIANENGFGVWVPSNNVDAFTKSVDSILASDIQMMGERGFDYLCNNYLTENTYAIIMSHLKANLNLNEDGK